MKDEWIVLSQIYVDSGHLPICYPCRTNGEINFMETTIAKMEDDDDPCQIGEGIGVVFPSGLGDGAYNVEALFGEVDNFGKLIKEIRVKFVGPDTLYG
jgi:hypothetical protein